MGVYVYFNLGGARFGEGVKIAGLEALPYSMAAGDLDHDGKPEIVLGLIQAPGIILWSDGDGKTYRQDTFGDGKGGVYAIAIGDLDGDGYPDLATARSDAPSAIYFNRPDK